MKTTPLLPARLQSINFPLTGSAKKAFTRFDLLVVLATGCLLAAVAVPALATSRAQGGLAICANNLRLIGRAFLIWGSDHGGEHPWWVPKAEGGQHPLYSGNAWVEFAFISNELATPKILACPSDPELHGIATDFSSSSQGGFLNSSYRANALSYFISLDTEASLPAVALSGDRDFNVTGGGAACSTGVNNASFISAGRDEIAWTNRVHHGTGNILLNDGQVLHLSSPDLSALMNRGDDNLSLHLLMPR